jgi:SAM-dependent methyltransferase
MSARIEQPEPSDARVEAIRASYDRVADAYADAIFDELRDKPFDRDVLTRFAASTSGRGRVCDIGCGPGQIARFLHQAGADAIGLDLSRGMIEQARRLNPGVVFYEGNMLALDLPDGSLAGITAFYAIVNLPPDLRPHAFQEMARVLQPGGLLLIAFHIGGKRLPVAEFFGRPITMDFYLLERPVIEAELQSAGFKIVEFLERDPYPPPVEHQSRRAYLFARKL